MSNHSLFRYYPSSSSVLHLSSFFYCTFSISLFRSLLCSLIADGSSATSMIIVITTSFIVRCTLQKTRLCIYVGTLFIYFFLSSRKSYISISKFYMIYVNDMGCKTHYPVSQHFIRIADNVWTFIFHQRLPHKGKFPDDLMYGIWETQTH